MTRADPLLPLLQEWTGTSLRRSMRGMILFMKENELSMSQIGALFQIQRGKSNVSDLGERLDITIAAASQMLERLGQMGLIQRLEDPQDRRAKKLVLTDKGSQVLQESVQARQSWLADLAATFSAREKEQIAAAIKIMIDKNNQLDQNAESGR